MILVPPATAVKLEPGSPDDTSVTTGTTITFTNVNLTIRGAERIPVNFLNFTIFDNTDDGYVAHVNFSIDGTENNMNPVGKFEVTKKTEIDDGWYGYGYREGDADHSSEINFDYGYGYGYGDGNYSDITVLYDIEYTTHMHGTFYAKLFVNSTSSDQQYSYTYESNKSATVTVSRRSTGSPSWGTITTEEEQVRKEASHETLDEIEENYGVTLEDSFYAYDTDGDDVVDTFTDPNEVLFMIHETTINNNVSFLLSTIDNHIAEFLWDSEADSVTHVTHNIGNIIDTEIDGIEKNITVTVSVEKANWIYIEVTDEYPYNENLTVKTLDGRIISEDKIWRENGKIYVLDDPVTEYLFIYKYEGNFFLFDVEIILTPDMVIAGENISVIVNLINVGDEGLINATLNYTLYKNNIVIWNEAENISISGHKSFTKTIITEGFEPGEYMYSVVHNYGDNQTASASKTFTVEEMTTEEETKEENLWIYIIILIIVIVLIILGILFKKGILYI